MRRETPAELVRRLGPTAVAQRYVLVTRRHLDAIESDRSRDPTLEDSEEDAAACEAVISGVGLDLETRLRLVVTAAEAAAADDLVLWCTADMPADHLVGDSPEMGRRLHAGRRTAPGVDRMFAVMQAELEADGHPLGWWADDWPAP